MFTLEFALTPSHRRFSPHSFAIQYLQSFAAGGSRNDTSDRKSLTSASSLGSVSSYAYSTEADDDSMNNLKGALSLQVGTSDLAELSEDLRLAARSDGKTVSHHPFTHTRR